MFVVELKQILLRRRLLLLVAGSLLVAIREIFGGLTRAEVPGLFGVVSNSLGGTMAYPVIAGLVSADSPAADLESGHAGGVLSRRIRRHEYLLSKSGAMFVSAALFAMIHHLCLLAVAAIHLPWRVSLTYATQMEDHAAGAYSTLKSIPGPVPELCFTHPVLNDLLILLMTSVGAGALIAQALLVEPDLLLLDEPTNGLDPDGIVLLRKLLLELADRGVAILLASHLLTEIERLCKRVVFVNHGKIQKELSRHTGEPPEIRVVFASPADLARFRDRAAYASHEVEHGELETPEIRLDPGVDMKELLAFLVKEDIAVEEVRRRRPSLEDAFLSLLSA